MKGSVNGASPGSFPPGVVSAPPVRGETSGTASRIEAGGGRREGNRFSSSTGGVTDVSMVSSPFSARTIRIRRGFVEVWSMDESSFERRNMKPVGPEMASTARGQLKC